MSSSPQKRRLLDRRVARLRRRRDNLRATDQAEAPAAAPTAAPAAASLAPSDGSSAEATGASDGATDDAASPTTGAPQERPEGPWPEAPREALATAVVKLAATTLRQANEWATKGGVPHSKIAFEDRCSECCAPTATPDGRPFARVLICEECQAEVHFACTGLESMPGEEEPFVCRNCLSANEAMRRLENRRVLASQHSFASGGARPGLHGGTVASHDVESHTCIIHWDDRSDSKVTERQVRQLLGPIRRYRSN